MCISRNLTDNYYMNNNETNNECGVDDPWDSFCACGAEEYVNDQGELRCERTDIQLGWSD